MSGLGAGGSRSLLSAAVIGTGATFVVGALGVARTKVLALGLDPDGLGLYGQMLTLLTAMSAASGVGLGLGTTRAVAQTRARDDREGLEDALEVSFSLPLVVGAVLAICLAAASAALAPLLLDDDRASLIVIAALAVPVVAIQGPLVHAVQGFRDVRGAQAANVFFGVILTLASVAGVVTAGLEGAVLALAVGNLAYAAALAWRLRRLAAEVGVRLRLRRGLARERFREPLIRAMIAIGFASLFVGVLATVGDLAVRTFVLKESGADAAGNFSALQLVSVQVIGVIVTSVAFLSFTAMSESHATDDRAAVRRTLDDGLRLSLLLVLPIVVVLAAFSDDVVRLLFSSEFGPTAELLPRELTGDVVRTVAWALGVALVPVGMTRAWVGITAATVALYVAVAAVLVPADGLDGAVDAYVASWALAALATVVLLARRRLFAPGALTARTLVAAGAAIAIAESFSGGRAAGALIVVAYAGALLVCCTSAEERLALRERIAALRA